MSPMSRMRLMALAEKEYKRVTVAESVEPVRGKFKGMKVNVETFDSAWDRKRGAAARLAGVLLREDDGTLERRVCESGPSSNTYRDAAAWLQREAGYLRKIARLQELAGKRLNVVLTRCQSGVSSSA